MQLTYAAPRAWLRPPIVALVLAVLGVLAAPASGAAARDDAATGGTLATVVHGAQARGELVADPAAGWHGRAIRRPRPRPRLVRNGWPAGWSAGAVGPGTGFVRPGGSDRVRDVQRRLVQLGYRPGPVDGLYGPRTRAAVSWFQYKHGLPTAGRVNRSTLTVLHARSDHKPLRTVTREPSRPDERNAAEAAPLPSPAPPVTADDGRDYTAIIILALLLALGIGVITGLLGPELRSAFRTAPADARPTRTVLGYATDDADAAAQAIARRCALSGWSLAEVVHDPRPPGSRLAERRGMVYVLRELRKGTADGLVVARLDDVAHRIADLATLVHWLEEANAFLAAADHELDTSTETGRATARAIVELGAWERRTIEREDVAGGRFTPGAGRTPPDLADQLAAMLERGIPPRAVSDALVLAGFAGTPGDAKAMTEEGRRM